MQRELPVGCAGRRHAECKQTAARRADRHEPEWSASRKRTTAICTVASAWALCTQGHQGGGRKGQSGLRNPQQGAGSARPFQQQGQLRPSQHDRAHYRCHGSRKRATCVGRRVVGVTQIPARHATFTIPVQKPDIRLQVLYLRAAIGQSHAIERDSIYDL